MTSYVKTRIQVTPACRHPFVTHRGLPERWVRSHGPSLVRTFLRCIRWLSRVSDATIELGFLN